MNTKVSFFILITSIFAFSSCKKESIEEHLFRQAKEITQKQCPRPVDKYTTIDSVVYIKDTHEFDYYYTLNGALDNKEIYTTEEKDLLHETFLKDIRSSIQMKDLKDNKVTIVYQYFSKASGEMLFCLRFEPEDYDTKR